jgi:hypothetical protein
MTLKLQECATIVNRQSQRKVRGRDQFETVPYRSSEQQTDLNDNGLEIFPEIVDPGDDGNY